MKDIIEYKHKHESDLLNRLGSIMVSASLKSGCDEWETDVVVAPSFDNILSVDEAQKIKEQALQWFEYLIQFYNNERNLDARAFLAVRRDFGRDTWSINSKIEYFYNKPICEDINADIGFINKNMKIFMKNESFNSVVDFLNSGSLKGAKIDLVYSQDSNGKNIIHGINGHAPPDVDYEQWTDFVSDVRVFFDEIAINECGEDYEGINYRIDGSVRGTVSMLFAAKTIKSIQWRIFYDKRDHEEYMITILPDDLEEFFGSMASMEIEQLSM